MNFTAIWKESWMKVSFRVVVILECVFLLVGIFGLFLPCRSMEVAPGQERISLSPGIYNVRIRYQASFDENILEVYDTLHDSGSVLFGDVFLYSGDNEENCLMWVLRNTDTVRVDVEYCGNGILEVAELAIISTNYAFRIWIFLVVIFSVMINGILLIRTYDEKVGIPKEQKRVGGLLLTAFLISCIPMMVNYNLRGNELDFHLLRIEGLLSGLKDGQFPVRIQGNWFKGYGYAVSVFCSDIFLVIPVFFRVLGFTVDMTWRLFLIVINGATLLVTYECFRKVFCNRMVGCISTILYYLSAYRMHNLYVRSAIGEAQAMIFFPLFFYGLYRIFTDDIHKPEYKKNWLALTLGLTGIIQSNVLICKILALTILILCLILIKKVSRKETFLQLIKTVIMTLLLNMWYVVPFADYILTGKYGFYGQERIVGFGINNTGELSVGAALLLVFFTWLYLEWTGMRGGAFSYVGLGRLTFVYTFLFFVLSLNIFPWDKIRHMSGIVEKLTLGEQLPWQFMSLATVSASILAGVLLLYMKNNGRNGVYTGWLVLLTVVAMCLGLYQSHMQLTSGSFTKVYHKQSMGTTYVSDGEYQPYQADIDLMICDQVISGEGVYVSDYRKGQDTLRTEIEVKNQSDRKSYVELPLLYYKGYTACDIETGQELMLTAGDNSIVRVILPAGYSGRFQVWFGSLWYWRAAEGISLITVIAIVMVYLSRMRRKNLEEVAVVEE